MRNIGLVSRKEILLRSVVDWGFELVVVTSDVTLGSLKAQKTVTQYLSKLMHMFL